MTLIAIVIATPIGILAGTYLSEYSGNSRIGEIAKFINDDYEKWTTVIKTTGIKAD